MVNLCKILSYMRALKLVCVLALMSASGNVSADSQETVPAWMVGKNLKLTYSANDDVCQELLSYFDDHFKYASEFTNDKGEVNPKLVPRYDKHPWTVQKWQKVSHIKDYYKEYQEVGELDMNSDGKLDTVVRHFSLNSWRYKRPYQKIDVISGGGVEWFLSQDWSWNDKFKKGELPLLNVTTNNPTRLRPLKPIGLMDRYVLKKHEDYQEVKKPYENPHFYNRTVIAIPLAHNGHSYMAYTQPREDYLDHTGSHWGLVQRISQNWTTRDFCYLNLVDSSRR